MQVDGVAPQQREGDRERDGRPDDEQRRHHPVRDDALAAGSRLRFRCGSAELQLWSRGASLRSTSVRGPGAVCSRDSTARSGRVRAAAIAPRDGASPSQRAASSMRARSATRSTKSSLLCSRGAIGGRGVALVDPPEDAPLQRPQRLQRQIRVRPGVATGIAGHLGDPTDELRAAAEPACDLLVLDAVVHPAQRRGVRAGGALLRGDRSSSSSESRYSSSRAATRNLPENASQVPARHVPIWTLGGSLATPLAAAIRRGHPDEDERDRVTRPALSVGTDVEVRNQLLLGLEPRLRSGRDDRSEGTGSGASRTATCCRRSSSPTRSVAADHPRGRQRSVRIG